MHSSTICSLGVFLLLGHMNPLAEAFCSRLGLGFRALGLGLRV